MKLYFDTSVIGALLDIELPQRVAITHALLDSIRQGEHVGIVSNVVLEEVERCPKELRDQLLREIRELPLQVLSEDHTAADLLDIYEKGQFVRQDARLDLRHLAVATVHGVDAVVSWNFHDLVNIRTRRAVHAINLRLGYPLIEIVSPEEVVDYGR